MYEKLMVAVDNSKWSDCAVEAAIGLARACGAKLTGNHVYAARLHHDRFRAVEPGLPERYQSEEVLAHQREVHADLIGRGLQLVSDAYLDQCERRCSHAGVGFERKTPEGRNHELLAADARESGYDLVALGAHGLGHGARSIIGSVCERVLRQVGCDVLVAREPAVPGTGRVVVAIDGSLHALAGLETALALAARLGGEVSAVSAFDPFFHGVAFKSLASVLSEESAKLFRFREQEKLHDEIIDQGLCEVYRGHLEEARSRARGSGVELPVEVLQGKPVEALAAHLEKLRPSLLVVGRHGIHRSPGQPIGATAENLVRLACCNVLVVGREACAPPASREEGERQTSLVWVPEAEARLGRVPQFVRALARRRIEAFARGRGMREVTLEVFEAARSRFGM